MTNERSTQEKLQLAQAQARLIESVARFDAEFSSQDVAGGSFAATISQVREAHEQLAGFGETGEFLVGRLVDGQITFLLNDLDPVPYVGSELAEAMRRGLSGQSGTMVGLDYTATKVLAAYEPVAVLDVAIVAKIDVAEIRAPFIRTGLLGALGTFGLVILGTMSIVRIGNPMVEQI